ncbi:methionine--tRNA ligase [Veillonella caviae]|uniref:methionine--tRNA ligase n=1 Tax=Veillonella caviae TaxID=248316 RepID=UPI0023F24729|nr:methionine--tRNA ligase [Veillonella caviae]MCI6407536.1 methionine--tRNA ligase [Veillonella caviae]MDD7291784.1 methionine--tRNA ligase [Veillonella caviae]MDY5787413.1 methionine--tRNA ligase [Veillonella caviae]MDY6225857.1 methionine--tRNA ligase [Veillonella caviae]
MGQSKKTYYITTPIYYPSAKLHIGHTYCTSVADTIARFKRLAGYDVRFLTGSDEHGQKIQRAAEAEGITPLEYTTNIVNGFKALWEKMHISNDDFIRTTDARHEKVVQELFTKAYEKGDIYKAEYEGWYCTPDETFWTEQKLGPNHTCPDCGRPVERVKEESYFFKLGKYTDQWLQFIEENPDFIQPESRRNEMIQFVKQGLEDLAVSRTSFDWGIKVPFDPKHVVYVWFDALVNYISALAPFDGDGELYKRYWPADLHLVGKEIVRFHTIIWPMMLMSLELPIPKKVFGHGWMIVDGTKMSKSLGNVIDPNPLIDTYGADSLRYYLLSEIQLGNDGNFTLPNFVTKINADLSNDLGNLLNRTIAMIQKYHDGVITKTADIDELDKEISTLAEKTVADFEAQMEAMEINKALKTVWAFIGRMNKYIDETMPWVLAKSEAESDVLRLQSVMYHLAESLRIIAVLVSPVIPVGAPKIWNQLGLAGFNEAQLDTVRTWGGIESGTTVVKGEPIYPRFEIPEMVDAVEAEKDVEEVDTSAISPLKEHITYDDFDKLDLRVAKVLTCEKVTKSKKLLKFTLDIGLEERTVVSGISQYYEPEQMIGKKVIYLANLSPKKLMGIESYGMILSGSDWEENLEVTNIESLPAGSIVK